MSTVLHAGAVYEPSSLRVVARSPLVRMPKGMIKGFSSLHRAMVSMSGGRVGTKYRGQPLILLTTTGRKTGKPRTWPLVGLPIDEQDRPVAGSSRGRSAATTRTPPGT